jgi:radical SAM protein with 4Fe4S-binding SPASM domain
MKKQFNKIYIEITNVCNLDCSFCPKTNRTPEFMSFELFKEIITQVKPLCKEITLHVMGEPTLHPQFKEFVNYAKEENVIINLTTNGTNLSSTLLNTAIKKINFSIHSITDNFPKDNNQLKKIIEFTKQKRDDLIIIYRLWNINDTSNKEIFELLEKEFDIKINNPDKKGSTELINNTYIQYDWSFQWPDTNTENNSNNGYCHALSTHIGILSNGTVVPCCLDNQGNIALGNIKRDKLIDILTSKRALKMKKGFCERKLVEEMCKKCTYINRLERNKI